MCGIAGIYNYAGSSTVSRNVLIAMRDAMVHRGPDGAGLWVATDGRIGLAHRRLSIIDLDESAAQPMSNEDGLVQVTFNGEIYNHLSLRAELATAGHRFRTDHSDTEVLVHGYEEWGIDGLLQRLHGMWGFAVWDARERRLTLARDRVGIKPVYFALHNGALLFASEIKALLEYPGLEREISPRAMYHYLSFLTTPAPMTMFRGIYKLPAGHYLQVDGSGRLRAQRYWDALPGSGIDQRELVGLSPRGREEFYVRGIREHLEKAVEKRMMSDVPFGAFLSGGIDSSTNVALMGRYTDRPVNTFSVGFKDHTHLNELDYAERVAKLFGTRHHEVLIDEQDMIGYLDDLILHQDEPIADWVCIPLYFVSKLARDSGVTVVQVGEGADEQFCGYASYMGYLRLYQRYWQPFRRLPGLLKHLAAGAAGKIAGFHPRFEMYADIVGRAADDREHFWSGATFFWESQKKRLIRSGGIPEENISPELVDCGLLPESYLETDSFEIIRSFRDRIETACPGQDVLTRMIYNEFKLRLPELLLMRVDKITMANSLEARVPFLDHELVQFTMDIPMEDKVRGGQAKYLLKKAVKGWIPDDIINRKKMGFGAPMAQWLQGDFGNYVENRLLASPLLSHGYFDGDYIRGLFRDHRLGRRDNAGYIWVLFNLGAWYEHWLKPD
ncbi:MAG: asparagine synthase (glutamine-hydrolyzing) [Desulfobulbaceae bacterium]|nr:asparagine synthase (glutamine-hydrolyzing) [Desulfobulbaceae bacterium]